MATLRRHTSSSSDWGDIVKTCVSGGRRILVKMTGLGGLLGLFFSIDESDTSNYLWDQFEALACELDDFWRQAAQLVGPEGERLEACELADFWWQAVQPVVTEVERLEACELDDFRRQAAQLLGPEVERLEVFLRSPFDDLHQFVLSHRCRSC